MDGLRRATGALAALANPSMAGELEAVVGPWGRAFVSAGLVVARRFSSEALHEIDFEPWANTIVRLVGRGGD